MARSEALESVQKWVRRFARWLPIALALSLAAFISLGGTLLGAVDVSRNQAVSIALLLFGLAYAYFDWLIREVAQGSFESGAIEQDLAKCLYAAFSGKGSADAVRIYAISTGFIHPVLSQIFRQRGFQAKSVKVLVCDAASPRNGVPKPFASHVVSKLLEWRRLQQDGAIEQLGLWWYDFFPTEYFIVVNDTDLVHGRYVVHPGEPSRAAVIGAYHLTSKSKLGQSMIADCIESFDKLLSEGAQIGVREVVDADLHVE